MLVERFPQLGEIPFIRALRSFFRSWAYIAIIILLMVCAELFSLELVAFYIYLILCTAGMLFGEDALHVLPVACCSYMSISAANNPGHPDESAFYTQAFRIQFIVILSLAAVLLLARLITALIRFRKRKIPSLAIGFLALGLAFIFGGAFSGFYDAKTAFFGFVEIVSLSALYFYLYYTVDWEKTDKAYLFQTFLLVGVGVGIEILGMYRNPGVFGADGTVDRRALFTGWGMYNNVGCAMAMCIPAPFYFAATKRQGWVFSVVGGFFLLFLILAQSRGALLFGAVVFAACALVVLIRTKGTERLLHLVVYESMLLAGLIAVCVLQAKDSNFFSTIIELGFNDSDRFNIYRTGWAQFCEHPVFGVGFYQCNAWRWGDLPSDAFLPARYHNTYIQLIASGGAVALICYIFHRVQTAIVLFRRPSVEKTFAALCIAALILTSIVDCHFFNFGPGILYSVILVAAEGAGADIFKQKRAEPKAIEEE